MKVFDSTTVITKDAKLMEHSKICKMCYPYEPGKKKLGLHSCSLCDYKSLQNSLQRHFTKIHLGGFQTVECKDCGKMTKNLKMHIKNFHNRMDLYKCRYCDFRNFRVFNVQYHIGRRHPEMGLITCEHDKFGRCRFAAYSQRQLERHNYYVHEKAEPIPDALPKAEKAFIRNGIPIFQNYETIHNLPKGTTIYPCPYKPCHYQTINMSALKEHKKNYHEQFDLEKFMNETI